MSVLSDLEKQLGIQPIIFDTANLFEDKICLEQTSSEQVNKNRVIEDDQVNYELLAQNLQTEENVMRSIYMEVSRLYNEVEDPLAKQCCEALLVGLKRNTITKQRCNELISEINRLCTR